MIGDKIDTNHLNLTAANELLSAFDIDLRLPKRVIAIAGESGSGKTHMAAAIEKAFEARGQKSMLLHMDDFFKLPPALNHQNRLADLHNVGPKEVDLLRLQSCISEFKNGAQFIKTPLVHYYENQIEEIEQEILNVEVLIIEGTYSFYLEKIDFHLYMSRTFEQTRSLRAQRNRGAESQDPFIEQVLEIEHQLITAKKSKANAWVDFDFNLKYHV